MVQKQDSQIPGSSLAQSCLCYWYHLLPDGLIWGSLFATSRGHITLPHWFLSPWCFSLSEISSFIYIFLWLFSGSPLPYWNSSFCKSRHHRSITPALDSFWITTHPSHRVSKLFGKISQSVNTKHTHSKCWINADGCDCHYARTGSILAHLHQFPVKFHLFPACCPHLPGTKLVSLILTQVLRQITLLYIPRILSGNWCGDLPAQNFTKSLWASRDIMTDTIFLPYIWFQYQEELKAKYPFPQFSQAPWPGILRPCLLLTEPHSVLGVLWRSGSIYSTVSQYLDIISTSSLTYSPSFLQFALYLSLSCFI